MRNNLTALAGLRTRLAIGITAAGVLAGGGFAAAAMTGGTASASPGTATQAGQTGTTASNQELTALQQVAGVPAGAKARGRVPLNRLRALGGMYGEFTFRTKAGDRTLAFERGTISSVSGSEVVVRAPDGTSLTWILVSDTVIRDKGTKATIQALTAGELVFAGGQVTDGARDARLIVIRQAGQAAQKPAVS
jgi:hypothetical protein